MRYFSRGPGVHADVPGGDRRAHVLRALVLLLAVILAGVVVLSARSNAQDATGRDTSVYKDPDKPVLSYLLSEPENVEEFRREFGLSDAEVEKVLARTRQENRTLAGVYAESEKVLERSRGLSLERKRERISTSGYSEKVRRVVGGTKRSVEGLLPQNRTSDLDAWVEEQWQDEVREDDASPVAAEKSTRATRPPGTYRIFAT